MKKKELKISTLIGKGCVVGGDFKAVGSARIDGTVEGDISVEGTLILGAGSFVEGNITAQSVLVSGEVNGNIQAPDRTELVAGAKVLGDIETAVIVVDENAIFQGRLDMNQAVPAKRVRAKNIRAGKKSAKAMLAEALSETEELDFSENKEAAASETETNSENE